MHAWLSAVFWNQYFAPTCSQLVVNGCVVLRARQFHGPLNTLSGLVEAEDERLLGDQIKGGHRWDILAPSLPHSSGRGGRANAQRHQGTLFFQQPLLPRTLAFI